MDKEREEGEGGGWTTGHLTQRMKHGSKKHFHFTPIFCEVVLLTQQADPFGSSEN